MVAKVRIAVLVWADILAGYATWVMMTYLTTVWKLDIVRAGAIVNVFVGLQFIIPVGMSFLVDAFLGYYRMLLLSSLACCFGMSLLAMSTPPVLSRFAGNCDDYQPNCIGDTQKALFYTALALIAFGISGHMTSLESFGNQQEELDQTANGPVDLVRKLPGFFAVILLPIVGGIALPFIKPWSVRFGIPAICTTLATFLFISGSPSYTNVEPQGSPLTTVFRVFVASASKMFSQWDANHQLYGNHQVNPDSVPQTPSHANHQVSLNSLPQTPSLRCLDKAAMIVPTQTLEQQVQNKWKLCKVTEVEETKIFIRMIPMWSTFIMCGVVSSIGATYFLEQANKMNRKVGRLIVPLPILLIFHDITKSMSAKFYVKMVKMLSGKYAALIGMIAAMLFSILCCITAAKVETRRIDIIKSHGILDPNEKIPMSMFWLVPQYLLLGVLDGISGYLLGDRDEISGYSIACFFIGKIPASMSSCLLFCTRGVFGAGLVGSVLSVYVVGKVSERGGKPSWFQDTLNKSRLDKYYWTLAVLSSVNLFLSILVAIWYNYQQSSIEEIRTPGYQESDMPPNDDVQCCCCCA
ncbi:protein NRT1/ PTR FAMILY 5.5-like isoform X1 [Corylus avellana]|uniref:protein NRT1/ PTR FAMILY 5.5-like isoform X1 n=2 Tax=Corylus avellana TaxID=13451 RepID=UPI00286C3771|nr:protein NRT1/ PTR FAMILY 5.5-like isoform X1 [Corylus avellana]XP_059459990.1 protein NRT1/ PTR FAMILY 5.5-like isoform X1 [Corylus avellana]XP_059459991.1 protein NRT1/ PTR FAMILY 5.5-like isoform X1 [Corylus avellana]XP_059459993.1 protein NRT1/ PTR FAMILY 5.5-like isoform X1 [Corylus avellana]XP_059459994.1 protein NRT1/ PTR FAMILY 5.5-like isoform X1 [Corylus avellana]XP_059459995.1 protein NRT1/ PTR FAMILY 5.5-like isoform X1 [Corylus avellana]XP_059459996.1 protein NRT1/ PTR FAMILY 5